MRVGVSRLGPRGLGHLLCATDRDSRFRAELDQPLGVMRSMFLRSNSSAEGRRGSSGRSSRRTAAFLPLIPLLILALAPRSADAQIGIAVEGRVVDAVSEQPIGQALVLAVAEQGDTLFFSQTNETGLYFIPRQERATRFRIVVEALGFSREIGEVLNGDDEQQYWIIHLDPAPIAQDELIVEVERQNIGLRGIGFYERRNRRNAVFVDAEVMERTTVPMLGDILRRNPGISVTPDGEPYLSRTMGIMNGSTQRACLPAVYVDDVLARTGGLPVPTGRSMDALEFVAPPPSQVSGMEFYRGPSSVPPEYAGNNTTCGVLLIWTWR